MGRSAHGPGPAVRSHRGPFKDGGAPVDRNHIATTAAADTAGRNAEDDGETSRAVRGSAFNIAGAAVQTLLGFAVVFVVTNAYGTSGAGLFFTAAALFTLAGNGARLGTEASLTYFVARLRATGRRGEIRSLILQALIPTALVSTVLGLGAAIGAAPIAELVADRPTELMPMIRILGLALPSWSLTSALLGASRGFGTMRPSVFASQIVRPTAQLAFVAIVVLASDLLWPLALAWAAAATVALIPLAIWTIRRVGAIEDDHGPFTDRFWPYAGPRAGTDLVNATLERVDLLLVGGLVGSAAAGLYSAANRLILAGQMVMMATNQAMAPQLSARFAVDDRAAARDLLRNVIAWNVLLLWPAFIGLAFTADEVLPLFGPDFAEAGPLVIVLSVSLMLVVGIGVGDLVLLMTGSSLGSLVNNVVALVVMIVMSVVLLPRVGVVGAAWAWAASRLCLRVLSTYQVWRRTGIHPFGPLVGLSVFTTLTAWVPAGVVSTLVPSDPASVVTMASIGLAAQAALCFGFRRRLGLDELVSMLRPAR